MNNACLLLALGVVIFVIMQNKGGSKGSLSIKSLSKSSKSVMNTNVPIICVGVLFLVYMFMNNGGIEGFGAVNSCGISKASVPIVKSQLKALLKKEVPKSVGTDVFREGGAGPAGDFMKNELRRLNRFFSNLTGTSEGVDGTNCDNQGSNNPTYRNINPCNRKSPDGTNNKLCGYFYKNEKSNEVWGDSGADVAAVAAAMLDVDKANAAVALAEDNLADANANLGSSKGNNLLVMAAKAELYTATQARGAADAVINAANDKLVYGGLHWKPWDV
jgi:hypothetical protein